MTASSSPSAEHPSTPAGDLDVWLVVTRNTDADRSAHRDAHRAYMSELVSRGLIFASGPASDQLGGEPFGGVTVLRVADVNAARSIMDAEPYVKNGTRTYELIAWRVHHGDYASRG